MTELLLRRELEPAVQQQRRLVALRRLTVWWFLLAAAAVLLTVTQTQYPLPAILILIGLGVAAAVGAFAFQLSSGKTDYVGLARDIAQNHPELHDLLVTAIEQQRSSGSGRLEYLQQRVLDEALAEIRRREAVKAVPRGRMIRAQVFHAGALILFGAALLGMPRHAPTAQRKTVAMANGVSVTPGDVTLERGSALVVLATFKGFVPPEATLVVNSNGVEHRISLSKNLNDPVFGGSIPEVHSAFRYHVEHEGGSTPQYAVNVFEFPRLERADASVKFPEYTGLDQREIKDTRRVTAVEGSMVDLTLHLNKPVRSARLIGKGTTVALEVETNAARARLPAYRMEESGKFELQLVDREGRTNKMRADFALDVLTNQPPHLKLAAPRGDQRVSPLQEVNYQAEVQDDFGLRGWGLTYRIGGGDEKSVALGGVAPGKTKTNLVYRLNLEDLKVEPDQLVSYYLWADDFGPDGALRRTSSDMFFAEVRPFEEIFREGEGNAGEQQQQQQQQQGQNQSPTTRLAELQKQIINATWKLQRQESRAKEPSQKYLKDAPVLRDSQERALEQVEAMQENVQELRLREYGEQAAKHMADALEQLEKATNSTIPLPKALAAEQAAYQSLLKLQAREFQVMQAQGQQGQPRGGERNSRNQAQLNQLQLKRQQNPYQTQREAQTQQQSPERKEQLEALSRLKELAQRQEDINERLKEMQTAIQAAKTAQEREELQRELKRLREEQREMLADMDEMRQRMEQSQSSQEMAEARQQLDEARQEAQRASESLDLGSVSQALASGTRAERQLEEMRDEMRKASSGQFTEEMRDMRNEARELAEKEQQIRKDLQSAVDQPKSLSDGGQAKEIAERLAEQRKAATNILEQMRRVTEQSEAAEPLLYKELYDSMRRASQGSLDESLTLAEDLTKRSFLREAQPIEQRAGRDIDALARDIERAAASVLGDETEGLRNANRELEQLTQQLERELQRNAGSNGNRAVAGTAGTNGIGGSTGTNRLAAGGGQQGTNGLAGGSARGTNELAGRSGTNSAPSLSRGAGTNAAAGGTNGQALLASNQQGQRGQRGSQDEGSSRGESSEGGEPQRDGEGNQPGGRERPRDQQSQPGERGQETAGQRGEQPGGQQGGQNGQQRGSQGEQAAQSEGQQRSNGNRRGSRFDELFNQNATERTGGNDGGGSGPITGEEFAEWSQRLSNVEEMVDRPALRNDLARARDRARAARAEFKRHSKNPQWDLVRLEILKPLVEVRERIADELSRRESNESLAPIDRDPVPGRYGELVRRYYETLGGSENPKP